MKRTIFALGALLGAAFVVALSWLVEEPASPKYNNTLSKGDMFD